MPLDNEKLRNCRATLLFHRATLKAHSSFPSPPSTFSSITFTMSEEWKFHGYTLHEIYDSLGSPCQATLANGKTFSGHLYNVDPETLTLLILQVPPTPTPRQELSSEQAKDTILETSEQQQQKQERPLPENAKKPQDQEPTQTQTHAQAPPSSNQPPISNATLATNEGTQSLRPTMVAIRQHALKTFSIGKWKSLAIKSRRDQAEEIIIQTNKQTIIHNSKMTVGTSLNVGRSTIVHAYFSIRIENNLLFLFHPCC
ncbi:MAG: hypothetical protein JOS17DRAFT_346843 [Linnemannia elongata]|nr:MAG: hypothetical protein JOS17DRAFT_346843 [Linnemannia elongata]